MKPHNTQIISAEPIDPLMPMMPVGETKMPEPIMVPTTSEMPPKTVMLRSNFTPPFLDGAIEAKLSLRIEVSTSGNKPTKVYLPGDIDIFS